MIDGEISYRRFLNGEEQGFVDLIRDYKDGLTMYLCGVTDNISLAEEYMEETFFKLLTQKPKYSGKSRFKTWLYAIGRNTAIDNLRKYRKNTFLYKEVEYGGDDIEELERIVLIEERKVALHKAMRLLHPDYKQILYLTFFEDLSNEEAAAVMHKSKKQIENLVYRAKKALREELEREDFEYENI